MAKYENIKIKLTGEDGNAFGILGKVTKALRDNGVHEDEVLTYRDNAMSGDYNHFLQTTMKLVSIS